MQNVQFGMFSVIDAFGNSESHDERNRRCLFRKLEISGNINGKIQVKARRNERETVLR